MGLAVICYGEMPWYRTARNPKRLLCGALQAVLEGLVAFAYHWDARALSPNLVVALRRPAATAEPAPA